jgi:hypothetical protein
MSTPALRRVVRRETHSPRTVATFVAVILLILALVFVGLEIVLSLLGQPTLLLGPAAAAGWIVGVPATIPATPLVGVSVAIALVGVVLVWLAVAPGRRPKHTMSLGDRAVVVDNGVIASALAQHLAEEIGVARTDVTVGVGHRSVDVVVRPGAGVPLDAREVRSAAEEALDAYRLTTSLRTRVRIARPSEKDDEL